MDIDFNGTKHHFTAMVCNVQINGKEVEATIDSGAATSVITSKLSRELRETIDSPSKIVITTITGDSSRSLGVISDLDVVVNGVKTPIDVEVIDEPKKKKLILGNDYLSQVDAVIKYKDMKLILFPKTKSKLVIDVDFYADESDTEEESSSESEIEYESEDDLEEVHLQTDF